MQSRNPGGGGGANVMAQQTVDVTSASSIVVNTPRTAAAVVLSTDVIQQLQKFGVVPVVTAKTATTSTITFYAVPAGKSVAVPPNLPVAQGVQAGTGNGVVNTSGLTPVNVTIKNGTAGVFDRSVGGRVSNR